MINETHNRRKIGPIRPLFDINAVPPKNKRCERLLAGSATQGMVIDVTRSGIELNAYYTLLDRDVKYAILRKPVILPWEEIKKIKDKVSKPKSRKKKLAELDRTEEETDPEYLETLAIVTINGKRYYIDSEKRERRSVDRPNEVWKF